MFTIIYILIFIYFKRISGVSIWKKAVKSEIEDEEGLSTDHISVSKHAGKSENEAEEGPDFGSISGTLIEEKNSKEEIEDEEGLHTNSFLKKSKAWAQIILLAIILGRII